MNDDDAALLAQFAKTGDQDAFAGVVRRHLDLVYGAALRRTNGDPHGAADVAQEVFIQVARRARQLAGHPALAAWLHTATRNAALNIVVSEQRRKRREQQASAMAVMKPDVSPDWDVVRPALDAAIDELNEADRAAVVLRYLQRKSFAEVGVALHVGADAARMRTDRALARLRVVLEKRGITSTAAALSALINANTAVAAPTHLIGAIVPAAVAVAGNASGLFASAVTFMTPKTVFTVLFAASLAFVAGHWFGATRVTSPAVAGAAQPESEKTIAALRAENERLKADLNATLSRRTVAATPAGKSSGVAGTGAGSSRVAASDPAELARRQRAILNNLRQIAAARDQYAKEHNHPAGSLQELIGTEPSKYIRQINVANGEDYAYVSLAPDQPLTVVMKDGASVTYDPTGRQTTKVEGTPSETSTTARTRGIVDLPGVALTLGIPAQSLQVAWDAYLKTHDNRMPRTPEELVPYFATAKEGADYQEALDANKARHK